MEQALLAEKDHQHYSSVINSNKSSSLEKIIYLDLLYEDCFFLEFFTANESMRENMIKTWRDNLTFINTLLDDVKERLDSLYKNFRLVVETDSLPLVVWYEYLYLVFSDTGNSQLLNISVDEYLLLSNPGVLVQTINNIYSIGEVIGGYYVYRALEEKYMEFMEEAERYNGIECNITIDTVREWTRELANRALELIPVVESEINKTMEELSGEPLALEFLYNRIDDFREELEKVLEIHRRLRNRNWWW
jgi:hypothetical protein